VIAVWDLWIRLFHWSLASAVLFLLISGETGFQFYEWHRYAGEFVLLLLVFRLLWGVVGSSNVRFSALLHHPFKAVLHLIDLLKRNVADARGHNAAGSWAIILMIISLLTQALTGLFIADEDELVEGAFYGNLGSDLTDLFYKVHHINAELLMILVGLHVGMIILYWLIAGKNLVLPMITGKMHWPTHSTPPAVELQRWWVGLLCLLVVSAGIAWLVDWPIPF